MTGDIVLAGYVMTTEEWEALDLVSRAYLLAIASKTTTAELGASWDRHARDPQLTTSAPA
jgi:hypothetical protein